MSEFLKGNYKSPQIKADPKSDAANKESGQGNEFENQALERLGGSIAFVMKSKTFLWTPDADSKDAKPPKA